MAFKTSPPKFPYDIQTGKQLLGQLQPSMLLKRKPFEAALLTCLETFGCWVPLKRGPDLLILTSEHQFAKTEEIPLRIRFFIFALLQDVSSIS